METTICKIDSLKSAFSTICQTLPFSISNLVVNMALTNAPFIFILALMAFRSTHAVPYPSIPNLSPRQSWEGWCGARFCTSDVEMPLCGDDLYSFTDCYCPVSGPVLCDVSDVTWIGYKNLNLPVGRKRADASLSPRQTRERTVVSRYPLHDAIKTIGLEFILTSIENIVTTILPKKSSVRTGDEDQ